MARLVTISLLALISFATAAWAVDMPSHQAWPVGNFL